MSTPHFKRDPEPREQAGIWREITGSIGSIVRGKLLLLEAVPALVVGAAMVTAATGFGAHLRAQAQVHEAFTGRTEAFVEAAWWRLDFRPEQLPEQATNWAGFTRPSFCVALRATDPGTATRAVTCLRYREILDAFQAPYQLHALPRGTSDEPPIPWRNAQGALHLDIHIPEAGWHWLSRKPSQYQPFAPRWRPLPGVANGSELTYWEVFRSAFDQPASDLVELWQQSPKISAAFDPRGNEHVLPTAFLESNDADEIAPIVIPVGVIGAVFWAFGLLVLLPKTDRWKRFAIVAATLATAPWWGQWVWRGLDFMLDDASQAGQFLQKAMIPMPPDIEIMSGDYAGEPGDRRETYSLDSTLYSPLFEAIALQAPEEPLTQADALTLARTQVKAAIDAMPPPDRAQRFLSLACFAAAGLRGAGDLFIDAAEAAKDHPVAGPAAATFLDYQRESGYPNHDIDCQAVVGAPGG